MISQLFDVVYTGRTVEMYLPSMQLSSFFVGLRDPLPAVLAFEVVTLQHLHPLVKPRT